MGAWLRRGAHAAQLAFDRSDLWPAGALAWLAFAGWIPLLLVVARPDPDDLAFVGVSIYSSSAFPANAIALGFAVVAAFAALCGVAGMAEAALLRTATALAPARAPIARAPFTRASLTAFAIVLISSLPATAALAALLMGVAAVAPIEFQSPDIAIPILVRIAAELWPFLAIVLITLVVGQAFGGTALHRAHAAAEAPLASVLAASWRDLVSRPLRRLGVAAVGLLLDASTLLLTTALLRVLWAPIGSGLDAGRLATPETILLLLGFVAIWLALLLASGALHVGVSAWWALELAHDGRGSAAHASAAVSGGSGQGSPAESDTGGAH